MDISKLLKHSIKFFKLAAHNSGMTLSEAASVMNSIAKKFNIESNLNRNSNENDVRKIHRRLIGVMHSDVAGDSNLELLKKLNVAADTLSGKLNPRPEQQQPKQQNQRPDQNQINQVAHKILKILDNQVLGLDIQEISSSIMFTQEADYRIRNDIKYKDIDAAIFLLENSKKIEAFGGRGYRKVGYNLSWDNFKQIIFEIIKNNSGIEWPSIKRHLKYVFPESTLCYSVLKDALNDLVYERKITHGLRYKWYAVTPEVKLKDFTASNQQLPKIRVVKPVEKFTNLQDIFDDIGIPYSTDAVGIKDNFKIIVTNANDYIYVIFTEKLQNGTYKAAYGYMPMTDFKNEPINIKRLVHFVANVNDNNLRDMKFAGKNGLLSDIDSLKGLYN